MYKKILKDDPEEEVAVPCVESVLSSDAEFISTEDEESFGLRASTGDENSEVIRS